MYLCPWNSHWDWPTNASRKIIIMTYVASPAYKCMTTRIYYTKYVSTGRSSALQIFTFQLYIFLLCVPCWLSPIHELNQTDIQIHLRAKSDIEDHTHILQRQNSRQPNPRRVSLRIAMLVHPHRLDVWISAAKFLAFLFMRSEGAAEPSFFSILLSLLDPHMETNVQQGFGQYLITHLHCFGRLFTWWPGPQSKGKVPHLSWQQ